MPHSLGLNPVVLWINNTQGFHNKKMYVFANLYIKIRRGNFNKTLAEKSFDWLTKEAYNDMMRHEDTSAVNAVGSRRELIAEAKQQLVESFVREYESGEFDRYPQVFRDHPQAMRLAQRGR